MIIMLYIIKTLHIFYKDNKNRSHKKNSTQKTLGHSGRKSNPASCCETAVPPTGPMQLDMGTTGHCFFLFSDVKNKSTFYREHTLTAVQ